MILPLGTELIPNLNYIDLGTGGLIAQVLIAGGIGGLIAFRGRMILRKIKGAFRWKKRKQK